MKEVKCEKWVEEERTVTVYCGFICYFTEQ